MRLVMRRQSDSATWSTPMRMFTYGSREFVPMPPPFEEPTEINLIDTRFHNGVLPAPGAAYATWHSGNETIVPVQQTGDRHRHLVKGKLYGDVAGLRTLVRTTNGLRYTPIGSTYPNVVNSSGTLGIDAFQGEQPLSEFRDDGTDTLVFVRQLPIARVRTQTNLLREFAPFNPTLVLRTIDVSTYNLPGMAVIVNDTAGYAFTTAGSVTEDVRLIPFPENFIIHGIMEFSVTAIWGETLLSDRVEYNIETISRYSGWPFPYTTRFRPLAADGASGFYAWEIATATGFTPDVRLITQNRLYIRHAGVTNMVHEETRNVDPDLLPGFGASMNAPFDTRQWWAASARAGTSDVVYVRNTSAGPIFGGRNFRSAALAELRKVVDGAAQAAIDANNLTGYTVTPYYHSSTRDDFFFAPTMGIVPI